MSPTNMAELPPDFDLNFDIEEIRTQLAVLGVDGLSGDQLQLLKSELDRIISNEKTQQQLFSDRLTNDGSLSSPITTGSRKSHIDFFTTDPVSPCSSRSPDAPVNSYGQKQVNHTDTGQPTVDFLLKCNSNNSMKTFSDDYSVLPRLNNNYSSARSVRRTNGFRHKQSQSKRERSSSVSSVDPGRMSVETAIGASNSHMNTQSDGQDMPSGDRLPVALPSAALSDGMQRSDYWKQYKQSSPSSPQMVAKTPGRSFHLDNSHVSTSYSSNKLSWTEYNHKSFNGKRSSFIVGYNNNQSTTPECFSSNVTQVRGLQNEYYPHHHRDQHTLSTKTNKQDNVSLRNVSDCGDSSRYSKSHGDKTSSTYSLTKLSARCPPTAKNQFIKPYQSKSIENVDSRSSAVMRCGTKHYPDDSLNDTETMISQPVTTQTPRRRITTSSRSARFADNPVECVHAIRPRTNSARSGDLSRIQTSIQNCPSTVVRRQDPVNRFHSYARSWMMHLAPGENARQALRWNVKAAMMHREVPLLQRNFAEVSRVFGSAAALFIERERQRRIKALQLDYVPPMYRRRHRARCSSARSTANSKPVSIAFSSTGRRD